MSELDRIKSSLMEYYRHVYHFSKRWDGKVSLKDKEVIIYCEQGYGDIIQFLRYISPLKKLGCKVFVHAPKSLHPILPHIEGVDEILDKENPKLPPHDYHILSLSLPEKLGLKTVPTAPYINYPHVADLDVTWKHKIGIAWEGSVQNSMNERRSCPLKYFGGLLTPETGLFMLQKEVIQPKFSQNVDFDIFGMNIDHFGHVADMINAVDYVVTVDTAVLHLAGAMGKRTFGLLCSDADPRWEVTKWYDTVTLLKSDDWVMMLSILNPDSQLPTPLKA